MTAGERLHRTLALEGHGPVGEAERLAGDLIRRDEFNALHHPLVRELAAVDMLQRFR